MHENLLYYNPGGTLEVENKAIAARRKNTYGLAATLGLGTVSKG